MTEEEFIKKWTEERPIFEAWGNHVVEQIIENIQPKISPLSIDLFLRIPPKIRLKGDASFLDKAFYRNKPYADAYSEITDKVGVRFVVLLGAQIKLVEDAITSCAEWAASKDRDYEKEQNENPIQFDYAAVHFVIRCKSQLEVDGVLIPKGTPCEVQVKTILQHAYSELTHDTIYKPKVDATPFMLRTAAKSMALIEATNDYFEQVDSMVLKALESPRGLTENLSEIYREQIKQEPEPTRAESLIIEAYEKYIDLSTIDNVRKLLAAKPFITQSISNRATSKLLFRQPSILLVYTLANSRANSTRREWPLTPRELKPIYSDLGIADD